MKKLLYLILFSFPILLFAQQTRMDAIYLKNGRAKLEIGLAKGKSAPDKRETVKKREGEREARRAIKLA